MRKIGGSNRNKVSPERIEQLDKLRSKARVRILTVNGEKQRVRLIKCPDPMECADLGSYKPYKRLAAASKMKIPKAGAR